MTDLPLHAVSETATTITLGHDPVPDAIGFRISPVVKAGVVQEGKWAHSWDGAATQHKFSPGHEPYRVQALMLGVEGVYLPSVVTPPPPPSPPTSLHRHRLTVQPGGTDPDSGAGNNYCFCWGKFRSATTRYVNDGHPRTIAWGSGELYSARNLVVLWRLLPELGTSPGRMLNFHTHPNYGGWTPDNSTGVSPIALDWFGSSVYDGVSGLLLSAQSEGARIGWGYRYHWQLLTVAELAALASSGVAADIRLDITIGAGTAGRVVGYVNGTQKFDTGGIQTQWPSQTAYSLWEGIYNSNGVPTTQRMVLTSAQVGRTLVEAQADVPTEAAVIGSVLKSNGQPGWTHTVLG